MKYLTLGIRPSDDNASIIPYLRGGLPYFAVLKLFRL